MDLEIWWSGSKIKIQSTGFSSYVTILEMVVSAEIVGVSESALHAFLSDKFPPNGKRGDSCVYYSTFGESVKSSLLNLALCNTKMRQFVKRNKIQLMHLMCLDAEAVLVVPAKKQVTGLIILSSSRNS